MKQNYHEYKTLDKKIDRLYGEERFEEAINMLENSYEDFPQFNYELTVYTIFCCREMKNYDKCLKLFDEGIRKGYFYGLHWSFWDPMKSYPQWNDLLERNEKNKTLAQKTAKMEYKVFLPQNYDSNRTYPLFITLHGDGNGCNIEDFSLEWQPEILTKKDWLVAFVQSSQVSCTTGFGWTRDYGKTRNEITGAYKSICQKYSVKKEEVIVGGFSGGSMASLNLLMNDAFSMKGIVALCPSETDDCTEENFEKAAKRGSSMVLLEGEKSGEVPFHKTLMDYADKSKMRARYVINNNVGHVVPEDFEPTLLEAVDFLMAD